MNHKKIFRLTFLVVVCFFTSSLFFYALFLYDNKYTMRAVTGQDSSVDLKANLPFGGSEGFVWLVTDWEFYPDRIVNPGETDGSARKVYIGQYFSFSAFHEDSSPYGAGTYRICVSGNGTYALLLPEVFSACRIYIDGNLISQSGSFDPYEPLVKDQLITFPVNDTAEILIQTVNYTHYYSGVTYPPAVGTPDAIHLLVLSRMLYYGFLCFTSLALAFFASAVWLGMRKEKNGEENFWLGIFALSFAVRICYPFIRMFGVPVTEPLYALEDFMAAVNLLCVIRILSLLCLKRGSAAARLLLGISTLVTLISGLFPLVFLRIMPQLASVYGTLLYFYKASAALLLPALLLYSSGTGKIKHVKLLIAGLTVYLSALASHAWFLGRFEPARFGWFEEWAGYLMVLFFSADMVLRTLQLVRENRHLNSHLEEEVRRKTERLSRLLEERRMLLSAFAHDLKTPITSISTFTRLVEIDNENLDEESRQYLDTIRRKTQEMQERIRQINEFTVQDTAPAEFEQIDITKLAEDFYLSSREDLDACGLRYILNIPENRPVHIRGNDAKLSSVLQNLVFNAAEFTEEGGTIQIDLTVSGQNVQICVSDTGAGIAEEDLPFIFDLNFSRHTGQSARGLGLFIVRSILTEHGGSISCESKPGKGSRFIILLPAE